MVIKTLASWTKPLFQNKIPGYLINKRAQRALGCSPEKKGKGYLQRTTNVDHQILVEDLQMMLYIKNESSGPCSFRQEDF